MVNLIRLPGLSVNAVRFKTPRDFAKQGKPRQKPWGTGVCACVDFQLAKLVWPPFVLGDASWLVTWSEQVIHREFNARFRREESLDEFLVATKRVGPLVVDPREVVDLKFDTGNCVAHRRMI